MSTLTVGNERNILNSNLRTFKEREQELIKLEELENGKKYIEEKKRKNSPYNNFVQVNRDYYKQEDWLMGKSPIAYRIFKFLINNMDNYNSLVCSQTVLQEVFNISRTTVARAIKLLKEKKYIKIYKSGTSNVYCINKNIVWSSWGSNYKYAKFGANIILSQSEQEQQIKSEITTEKIKQIERKEP